MVETEYSAVDVENGDSGEGWFVRKNVVWLSSLVFGLNTVTSRTEIVRHLSERKNSVYLFGISPRGDSQEESSGNFVLIPMKFVPVLTHLLYTTMLILFVPFFVVFRNSEYIIVDRNTTIVGLVLKLLILRPRPKIVLDIRSPPLRGKGGFQESFDFLMFRISVLLARKKFDGITIVTKLMRSEICDEFDISPEFMGVWTSGVSMKLFDPLRFDKMKIRKELGVNGRFVIFHHGSLGRPELAETIRGIGKLKNQLDEVLLFLLGDSPNVPGLPSLKTLIQENSLEDKVTIYGKVPYAEVPRLIASCDVAIIPLQYSYNWRYQSPLKLVEYLAMEKVVIATDIPANREIIGRSKCGIYIKTVDPEEIAGAIAFAYNNREHLQEWGASGRPIIKQKYTWEEIAKNLDSYLESLSLRA